MLIFQKLIKGYEFFVSQCGLHRKIWQIVGIYEAKKKKIVRIKFGFSFAT